MPGSHRKERQLMKEIFDRPTAAIVRFYHVYCDIILGAVLLLTGCYMSFFAGTIKIMKEPVSVVDTARFFPRLVFGALIPVAVVIIVEGIRKIKQNRETIPEGEKLAGSVLAFQRGLIALVMIAAFIALMEPLGFIPAAILYMISSMFFMSVKEGWKPAAYVITAVIVAVGCYFLFRQFVYVRLPAGILKGVLGA